MAKLAFLRKLTRALGRHRKGDEGAITIEAVLVLPLLIWWLFASYQFFIAFSERSINIKAAFTVTDIITRESQPVNPAYIEGLHKIFDRLTDSADPTWLRVTQIRADLVIDNKLLADWSYATGGQPVHTDATLDLVKGSVPMMSKGDYVILVETHSTFKPIINVSIGSFKGFGGMRFDQFVIMRPRFLSKIAYFAT